MTDAEAHAYVLSLRLICERLRQSASPDQLVSLGAELRAQQIEILETFRAAGKNYTAFPWA